MKKVINRIPFRSLSFLVLLMLMVLAFPGFAAAETAGVEMDLDAYNLWRPIVQTGSAPTYTLTVGQSTQATFEIEAIHEVGVISNLFSVYFSTVTDATYVNSMDIYLEELDGTGHWVKYIGRDGKEAKVSVVSSPLKITQYETKLPVKGYLDISTANTVGKTMRWAVYMSSSVDGNTVEDELIGEQEVTHWHSP